jgi:hypothetical protein
MDTLIQDRPVEVGSFNTVDAARTAVQGLLAAGFTTEHITVVCSDETKADLFHEFEHQKPAGSHAAAATAIGSTIGATLGGLTAFATVLATGNATLWAAGPISVWGGGVAGGLVGAMMTRGVEKELANFYQQAVIDGQILVAAEDNSPNSEASLARAAKILADAGAKPLSLPEG